MLAQNRDTSCIHHQQQLTFFCETCKEPVCNDCMVLGPHQTRNHVLNKLEEAYHNRQEYIKQRIEINLKKKKDDLVDHLQAIDDRMHEIEAQRVVIEKDVQMEFEGGIIKRLGDQKGQKLAVLQKDLAQLQKNINEIDDYIQSFEYLALTEKNVLPLLFMSKTLSKEMMRLLSIVVQVQINVTPFDLPRELLGIRAELENAKTLQEQINFKKEVVWRSRLDKLTHIAKQKGDFFEYMEGEVSEWVRLMKRVVGAFDSLGLICSYCGCFLDQDLVNEDCMMNKKPHEEVLKDFKCLTQKEPKAKHYGSYKHFFAEPKSEFLVLKKDQYPNFGEYYEQKLAAKEIYLKTFRTLCKKYEIILGFSIVDLKARKYLKQYDLQAIFTKYDKENTGWLTLIKFKYLLHKDLEMNVQEVENLCNFFKDDKEDKINYAYFLNVDWYIDELQRLEQKLSVESHKYKILYPKRSPIAKRILRQTQEREDELRQFRQIPKYIQPIYPYGIRFSEGDRKIEPTVTYPDLTYGFGFKDRPDQYDQYQQSTTGQYQRTLSQGQRYVNQDQFDQFQQSTTSQNQRTLRQDQRSDNQDQFNQYQQSTKSQNQRTLSQNQRTQSQGQRSVNFFKDQFNQFQQSTKNQNQRSPRQGQRSVNQDQYNQFQQSTISQNQRSPRQGQRSVNQDQNNQFQQSTTSQNQRTLSQDQRSVNQDQRSSSLNSRQAQTKSILKSSFPAAPPSRFQVTQSASDSYLYKYYQQ